MAAHAMTRDGIIAAINAGASTIEHGSGMDEECMKLMADKKYSGAPPFLLVNMLPKAEPKQAAPLTISLHKPFQPCLKKHWQQE